GRTWQMPPLACAPNTIPRGPAPSSRTAVRAGGAARYLCRPVIVTPQDGPAGEDCGLVAVASGVGAGPVARGGGGGGGQPEPAKTSGASAQPKTFSHVTGDPQGMSSALQVCPRRGAVPAGRYRPQTCQARCHAVRVYSDFGVIHSEPGVMGLCF